MFKKHRKLDKVIKNYQGPKLNGNNYHVWRAFMQVKLNFLGLEQELSYHNGYGKQALFLILDSIEPDELEKILTFAKIDDLHAYSIWARIKDFYE